MKSVTHTTPSLLLHEVLLYEVHVHTPCPQSPFTEAGILSEWRKYFRKVNDI